MDKRVGQINKLNEKIEEYQKKIQTHYRDLGEHLNASPQKTFTKTPLATISKDAKKIQSSIKEYEEQIKRIEEIETRRTEIKNEFQELDEKEKEIEKENGPIYARIGAAAFDVYKETPAQFHQYADIFAPLMDQQNEIIRMERDISALSEEEREKGFLGKLVDRGQAAFLKSKRKVREKTLPRYFQGIGKKVCDTDFIDIAESEELEEAAKPYRENMAALEEIRNKRYSLNAELETLEQELIGFTQEEKTSRKLEELRRTIKDEQRNLSNIYERIGSVYVKHQPEEIKQDDEITNHLRDIQKLNTEIEDANKTIEKLEAAIEVSRIEGEINRMKRNISSLEEDIQRSQQRIEQLNQEIADAEKEKTKHEKIRGPEEDLTEE